MKEKPIDTTSWYKTKNIELSEPSRWEKLYDRVIPGKSKYYKNDSDEPPSPKNKIKCIII